LRLGYWVLRRVALVLAWLVLPVGTAQAIAAQQNGVLELRHAIAVYSDSLSPPDDLSQGQHVALPRVSPVEQPEARGRTVWYVIDFELTRAPGTHEVWCLYLPYLYNGGRVVLNGRLVGSVPTTDAQTIVRLERPQLFNLSAGDVRVGRNRLALRLKPWSPRAVTAMPAPTLGPWQTLLPLYERRLFWVRTMAQVTVACCLVVSTLVLAVWLRRREEVLYGLFGLAALMWGLRTMTFVLDTLAVDVWWLWRTLYHAATAGFIVTLAAFSYYLSGLPRFRVFAATMAAYALIGPLAMGLTGGSAEAVLQATWVNGLMPIGLITPFLAVIAAWRQRNALSWLLVAALSFATVSGIHDQLLAQRVGWLKTVAPDWFGHRIFLLHHAANVLLAVMGCLLVQRFLAALRQAQDLHSTLEVRVAAKEREVAENYQRIAELDRQATRNEERARMMQDMHDGLGSQLFTSLAKLQRGHLDQSQLARILESCIADMRLTLDATDPEEDDLLAALSSFRFRWNEQVQGSGIEISWVLELGPGPVHAREGVALQLLRILQEALSNAIRHSGGSRLEVRLTRSEAHLLLEVADNGRGMPAHSDSHGHGMQNMKDRARRIGGELTISSSALGTTLSLRAPGILKPSHAAHTKR
jgi:signal transduction histidine kinase